MYDEQRFAQRLSQLRLQKGVSARDMSLSLGQSESYINKIENGKSLPSMMGFFYICEYFGITPEQFFGYDNTDPLMTDKVTKKIKALSPKKQKHLIDIIDDMLE